MADVAYPDLARRADPVNGILGDLLRQLRDEKGMTQAEVADRADISRGSVANIERGDQGTSVALLLRLVSAMDGEPAKMVDQLEKRLAERPASELIDAKLREQLDDHELDWVLSGLQENPPK